MTSDYLDTAVLVTWAWCHITWIGYVSVIPERGKRRRRQRRRFQWPEWDRVTARTATQRQQQQQSTPWVEIRAPWL